jgi:hypothetical protein
MKRGDKVAVACAAGLAFFCVTFGILYLTGWLSIFKNVALLGGRGNALVTLANRTPFTPPASGCVDEERLKAYLEVCCTVKPLGDRIDAWEEANAAEKAHGKRVFKGKAAGLVGDYLREFEGALEAQRMGPAEFSWVAARMGRAAEGSTSPDHAGESDRILYAKYEERLRACALGVHALKIATGFAN